ncbi:MAG: hypothetical protein J4F35_10575 [Candidatus Latescibacteria bacterium]|nr:hypothetical protein [Candidatus Latescibacterota bacterium]
MKEYIRIIALAAFCAAPASVASVDNIPPAPVTNLQATASDDSFVSLSWTLSADDARSFTTFGGQVVPTGDVHGYRVYRTDYFPPVDDSGAIVLGWFTREGSRVDFDDFFLLADRFGSSDADGDFELFFDIVPNGQIDVDDFLRFADDFGKDVTQEQSSERLVATLGSGVSEFVDNDVVSGASYVYDVRAFDGDNETGVVAPFASNEDIARMAMAVGVDQ